MREESAVQLKDHTVTHLYLRLHDAIRFICTVLMNSDARIKGYVEHMLSLLSSVHDIFA